MPRCSLPSAKVTKKSSAEQNKFIYFLCRDAVFSFCKGNKNSEKRKKIYLSPNRPERLFVTHIPTLHKHTVEDV